MRIRDVMPFCHAAQCWHTVRVKKTLAPTTAISALWAGVTREGLAGSTLTDGWVVARQMQRVSSPSWRSRMKKKKHSHFSGKCSY